LDFLEVFVVLGTKYLFKNFEHVPLISQCL
jgi:hypothetical protein